MKFSINSKYVNKGKYIGDCCTKFDASKSYTMSILCSYIGWREFTDKWIASQHARYAYLCNKDAVRRFSDEKR